MHTCAFVAKQQSGFHIVGEREMYKKERDVLEMRETDECDMRNLVH